MRKKLFKSESKRLLDLMVNSIYTNKEIFLREIISNASDALDKLHYISLTDETVREKCGELHITIKADKEKRTLTVSDNGVGMTLEELEDNLGTIAKSGSLKFKEEMKDSDEAVDIIGQFGVGFYSAFMVSDDVTVISRSYKEDTANCWNSTGADGYTVSDCEKDSFGTEIVMQIKPDTDGEHYSDYLEEYRLRSLIKTYSDYIRHPIKMEVSKSREVGEGDDKKTESYKEEETINSMVPIWQRTKSEVSDEECNKYYKDKFFDYNDPTLTIRVSAEGVVAYKAMLFVPSAAPYDYYNKEYKKGLQLYSSGVLIMEACEDLLPDHFRFVKGVIDSSDLSLNISREMLQQDRQLKTIATNIDKKIRSELSKLLENDREKYEKFYGAFGLQLKYGIVSDYGTHKEELKDLLLFYSSSEKKLTSLKEYVARMPEGQENIFFACGGSVSKIDSLPQSELARDKGFEVLYLTDEVDEFVMKSLLTYNEKKLVSVLDDDNGLVSEDDKKKNEEKSAESSELLEFVKTALDGAVNEVTVSATLKNFPVFLSAKGPVSLEMEKYFAAMPGENKPKAERVLELNPDHGVFEAIKNTYKDDPETAKKYSKILHSEALLMAGLPLDNPAEFCSLISDLMK